jgi:Mor family transcriptional regulator
MEPRDAAIIRDYKAGYGILELMKIHEVPGYQTVVNVIRAAEVKTKTTIMRPPGTNVRRWAEHHKANADRDQAIVELYLDGHSITWLQHNFNLAWLTVQRVLKRVEEQTGEKIIRPQGTNQWFNREETDEVAS